MESLIDAAGLAHSGTILRPRIVVAGFQLLQRNFVGRVTVDFVGAHENENSVAAMLPCGFEEIDRSEGIDLKIKDGNIASFVMGRLRSAVNNQIEVIRFEQFVQRVAVANIEVGMLKILGGTLEAVQIPGGVALGAKKDLAHVVVHADDAMALPVKMLHRFRTD